MMGGKTSMMDMMGFMMSGKKIKYRHYSKIGLRRGAHV